MEEHSRSTWKSEVQVLTHMVQEEGIEKHNFQVYLWKQSKNLKRLFEKWSAVIIETVPKQPQTKTRTHVRYKGIQINPVRPLGKLHLFFSPFFWIFFSMTTVKSALFTITRKGIGVFKSIDWGDYPHCLAVGWIYGSVDLSCSTCVNRAVICHMDMHSDPNLASLDSCTCVSC